VASKQPQKQPKKEQTGSKSDSKPLEPTEPPKVNRVTFLLYEKKKAYSMITKVIHILFLK
jgi:hypothetical protein